MAKTAGRKTLFIDTNVLIYTSLTNSPFHSDARNKLNFYAQSGYELWISRQIIREYLVVMSRTLDAQGNYNPAQLVKYTRNLIAQFQIADETDAVLTELFRLVEKRQICSRL